MKYVYILLTVALLVLPTAASVSAQADAPETISVAGVGSATGAPDLATLEIGVENIEADVETAFDQTNTTIQAVIDGIVAAGVARWKMCAPSASTSTTREDVRPGV